MVTFLAWVGGLYLSGLVVLVLWIGLNYNKNKHEEVVQMPPVRLVYNWAIHDRRKIKDRRKNPMGGRRSTDVDRDDDFFTGLMSKE